VSVLPTIPVHEIKTHEAIGVAFIHAMIAVVLPVLPARSWNVKVNVPFPVNV